MRISLAVITLALLAAGCGGSGQENKPAENQPTETATSTSDAPKNVLTGDWKESAGQSDKVQETLSKAGFECSRSSMDYVDLRMCVKSVPPASPDKGGFSTRLKFMADGKGTVVRAAVDGASDREGKMRHEALTALLPAQDVAVVEASGQTLTWGTMKEQQDTVHLVVKGGESAPSVLNPISFNTTKEQALPKMQAGGFKCEFKAPIGSQQQTSLDCTMFGGGFENIQRTASLTDEGNGLSAVTVKAWQGKTTEQNIAALKSMVTPAFEVSDDLKDIKAYVEKNLDGKEHSAYVGKFIVTIQVAKNLMFGDSAAVNVTYEKNNFGATRK